MHTQQYALGTALCLAWLQLLTIAALSLSIWLHKASWVTTLRSYWCMLPCNQINSCATVVADSNVSCTTTCLPGAANIAAAIGSCSCLCSLTSAYTSWATPPWFNASDTMHSVCGPECYINLECKILCRCWADVEIKSCPRQLLPQSCSAFAAGSAAADINSGTSHLSAVSNQYITCSLTPLCVCDDCNHLLWFACRTLCCMSAKPRGGVNAYSSMLCATRRSNHVLDIVLTAR